MWIKGLFKGVKTAVCLIGLCSSSPNQAEKFYKEGRQAEREGEMAQAYLLYSRAAGLEPNKKMYWLRSQAVRSRAAMQAKIVVPEIAPEPQAARIPQDTASSLFFDSNPLTAKELAEVRKPLPPMALRSKPVRLSFDFRADAKTLYEEIAKAFGLDCVFDNDFQPGKLIRFELTDADYEEALYALQSVTSTFIVPMSDKVFLVVPDTQQKRNDVEMQVSVSVEIPTAVDLKDAQELARTVQQVMEIKRFAIDSQRRIAVIRDRLSRVLPAQALFRDLLYYKPEIQTEIRFLEASKVDALRLGLTLPNEFDVRNLGPKDVLDLVASPGYPLIFGGGLTRLGLVIGNGSFIATMTKSGARTLLDTTMVSTEGMPATFHVGDRYPILSAGYFGPSDFQGDDAYRPPPSITFEDLGIVLKVTAKTHGSKEVTLEVEAEFKVLGGGSVNGIPIISSRKMTSQVRLEEGQWGVLGGLMSLSEARNIAGIAGLSQIPGLGALFSRHSRDSEDRQVLILLKPRILTSTPPEIITKTWWVGTESRSRVPL